MAHFGTDHLACCRHVLQTQCDGASFANKRDFIVLCFRNGRACMNADPRLYFQFVIAWRLRFVSTKSIEDRKTTARGSAGSVFVSDWKTEARQQPLFGPLYDRPAELQHCLLASLVEGV